MRSLFALTLTLAIAAITACGNVETEPAVLYPVTTPTQVRIDVHPAAAVGVAPAEPSTAAAVDNVVVTTARRLDRPTEVVGIIDEHEPSGRQDAAFALLRRRAAAMGADAVLGVEFHHGDEPGETTHLSGLAVRYTDATAHPGEWR